MLVPMRMTREDLLAPDAVDAVLRENLYGLELDPRCVELAAFSLALAAWKYPGAGGYRPLPELNLACSGLSVGADKESWTELAAGRRNLRIALDWLHDAFQDAPILGSLLDSATTQAAELIDWRDLSVALAQALDRENSDPRREAATAARGLARAAEAHGEAVSLGGDQRALPRPRQTRRKAARFLQASIPRCKERSGYSIPGALPGSVHGRWNRQSRPCLRTGCFSRATGSSGRSC